MTARQIIALFSSSTVGHQGQQIGAHTSEIEQGVALGGGAVPHHPPSGPLLLDQEEQQVVANRLGACLKGVVSGELVEASVPLRLQQGRDRSLIGPGIIVMTAEEPQAAAMGRKLLNPIDPEASCQENTLHGQQRKIGKVLVIDRVELPLRDQLQQMGKFQRDRATGLERNRKATGEIIDVRDMGIDVVAQDQIRLAALGGQTLRQGFTEELTQHGDPQSLSGGGGAGRGLDPQAGNPSRAHVLQQVAIVAGHLNHQTGGIKPQVLNHLAAIQRRMRDPAGRGAGKVGVVMGEESIGRGKVLGLHQPAAITDLDPQREGQLGLTQIGRRKIGIGRGREAQIKKAMLEGCGAVAAVHAISRPAKAGVSRGWAASRSEMVATGKGQAMASRGSSQRAAHSCSGE